MAPDDDDSLEGDVVSALDLDEPHGRTRRDDFYARDLDGPGYPPIIDVEPEPPELERAEARADAAANDDGNAPDDLPAEQGAEGDEPGDEPAPRRATRNDGRDVLRAALLQANGARRVRYGRLPASLRAKGVTAGVFVYGPSNTVVVLR